MCSLKGPYKSGDMSDLKIAKEEGLVGKLRKCKEKCIADGTYRNRVFINSREGNPHQLSQLIASAKARHETINTRFKRFMMFKVLRGFRHSMDVHAIFFHAIANLMQLEIEIDSPLFSMKKELDSFDRYYVAYCNQYYNNH